MSDHHASHVAGLTGTKTLRADIDVGLRQFLLSVYNYMASGLALTGLVAYDTQRIKDIYLEIDSSVVAGKKAIMGALALYLDFLNLFILLMQITGDRRI